MKSYPLKARGMRLSSAPDILRFICCPGSLIYLLVMLNPCVYGEEDGRELSHLFVFGGTVVLAMRRHCFVKNMSKPVRTASDDVLPGRLASR